MLKNYFLLGFRNLQKNKVPALINILGLSAAVGCAIALFLLLQVLNTSDDFHLNGEMVFLVGHTVEQQRGGTKVGDVTPPLGSCARE